jgi:hypothetical protein
MDNLIFGEKFKVYDFTSHNTYEIESNSMINALDYMYPFLKQNIMPPETQIIRFITENGGEIIVDRMKDFYNHINESGYFDYKSFNGFISLDKYEQLTPIEKYINEEDNIIIFVYEENIRNISNIKNKARIYTF